MLTLLIVSQIVSQEAAQSSVRAVASVRIQRAARVSEEAWIKSPRGHRREITRTEPDGRTVIIRVIEYQ
jgi:hypothetical protein